MNKKGYCIVLDFDGTVVKHAYPAVGADIGAVPVLKRLIANGCNLVLSTMRSHDSAGVDTLQPAIDWFEQRGIPLYGINENPTQKEWTSSPKAYGELTIDDGALGAPLKTDGDGTGAYMDWNKVAAYLYYMGLLSGNDLVELVNEGSIDLELQFENKSEK